MVEKYKKTKLDRFISWASPEKYLKRVQSRMLTEMAEKNWSGSSTTKPGTGTFLPGTHDIDSSLLYERQTLIDRSRDHVRNVPVAKALIDRICDHAVGEKGLMLHPKIDTKTIGMTTEDAINWQEKTAARWRLFAESVESDHQRRININKKGYVTLQSQLEGGDCFTVFLDYERPGSEFSFKTQTLESEYVSNPNYTRSNADMYEGIQKKENGEFDSIWISNVHPGNADYSVIKKWQNRKFFDKNGNRLILHHINQIRPNQSRGVPILGPVTNKLLNLNKYSDSELLAAVIQSYLTVVLNGKKENTNIIKKAPIAESSRDSDEKYQLGSGSVWRLDEETKIDLLESKHPNTNFAPYFEAMLAEIGAACGVPRSLILMLFDKSYSASRGEVILAWITFLKYRVMIASSFYQPVYERFLDLEVANGNIAAPGYFESPIIRKAYIGSAYHQWTGPVREAIDELKNANMNKIFNDMKVKSKKQIAEEISSAEWESIYNQIKHENDLLGITEIIEEKTEITDEESLIERMHEDIADGVV